MQTTEGHAAVGRVVGQRCPDGTKPRLVDITYERQGEEREARVLREVSVQQVEFSKAITCRFFDEHASEILVDELLDAEPVCDQ